MLHKILHVIGKRAMPLQWVLLVPCMQIEHAYRSALLVVRQNSIFSGRFVKYYYSPNFLESSSRFSYNGYKSLQNLFIRVIYF
jgi:hypothetical protein